LQVVFTLYVKGKIRPPACHDGTKDE